MAVQRRQSQAAQQFTAGDMKHVHIADETTFVGLVVAPLIGMGLELTLQLGKSQL